MIPNSWWMQASDLVNFPRQMPCRDTIKYTVSAITRPFVLTPQHVIRPHYSLTPKLSKSNRELCKRLPFGNSSESLLIRQLFWLKNINIRVSFYYTVFIFFWSSGDNQSESWDGTGCAVWYGPTVVVCFSASSSTLTQTNSIMLKSVQVFLNHTFLAKLINTTTLHCSHCPGHKVFHKSQPGRQLKDSELDSPQPPVVTVCNFWKS